VSDARLLLVAVLGACATPPPAAPEATVAAPSPPIGAVPGASATTPVATSGVWKRPFGGATIPLPSVGDALGQPPLVLVGDAVLRPLALDPWSAVDVDDDGRDEIVGDGDGPVVLFPRQGVVPLPHAPGVTWAVRLRRRGPDAVVLSDRVATWSGTAFTSITLPTRMPALRSTRVDGTGRLVGLRDVSGWRLEAHEPLTGALLEVVTLPVGGSSPPEVDVLSPGEGLIGTQRIRW
jgi:hypothetical protein